MLRGLRDAENINQKVTFMPVVTSPHMTIAHRAEALANQFDSLIDSAKYPKVHLICHSFGGVDARLALSEMGLSDKVHSLTTLATPHHGCALVNQA